MAMTPPVPKRLLFLGGMALLLAIVLLSRWIAGWGLVTLHVKDAPLAKVLSSIARQGGVRVETSLDPAKPVTLDVEKVTPAEAMELLAVRTDSGWRPIYVIAPSKTAVKEGIATLHESEKNAEWRRLYYPMPQVGMGMGDPSGIEVRLAGQDLALQQLLDQTAQKSGVMILSPKDWSPAISSLPAAAPAGKIIASLAHSAHGEAEAVLFLSDQRRRGGPTNRADGQGGADQNQADSQGDPFAGFGQGRVNPEWREERVAAQIQQLPPEQQAAAKQEVAEIRAIFEELRQLPREERRAKWEELMSNPDFVDRMENRRAVRQQSMSAEQRIDRGVSYLERRQSVLSGQGATSPGR